MLIPFSKVCEILKDRNIIIKGILHVGAHECEERKDYNNMGILDDRIFWIEANPKICQRMNYIKNMFNYAVSDKVEDVVFNITNNGQSSSILEFGTHQFSYPWCKVVEKINLKTERLDNIIEKENIKDINFWNLDIQGVELNALIGAGKYLYEVDAIYSEVNTQEVYKNCSLINDMDNYLEKYNFKRVMISMTNDGWGDALWIKQ